MSAEAFVRLVALELAVDALLGLLQEANEAIVREHDGPWHETCPTCETYERIDRVLSKRALAQVTGEEGA